MSFLKKIVKTAGKGIKGTVKIVGTPTRLAAKTAGKIPVVGKPLKASINLTVGAPYRLADALVSGERIDKAALNHLKSQVHDVKEVAPYAQMVVSVVPGIGQGISAGLGAGLALADGQPITAAIKAGVEGALPGGPAAKVVFNASIAVIEKKSLVNVAIASLPLPPAQKNALGITLNAAAKLAKGQRVDKVALDAAQKALPAELKPALNIGLAVAQGANLQRAMLANVTPTVLVKLASQGGVVIAGNPTLKAGSNILKDEAGKSGFAIGAAVSRFSVTPAEVVAIRNKLKPAQKKGFDMALAAHIGAVEKTTPTGILKKPGAIFAFNTAVGAQAMTKSNQKAIVKQIVKSPQARAVVTAVINAGPKVALNATITPGIQSSSISYLKPAEIGFWRRLFIALGFIER